MPEPPQEHETLKTRRNRPARHPLRLLRNGQGSIKQFTACAPVAKWTCVQAWRRKTANNAAAFLDKLQTDIPFLIKAIQIDGGAEFKAAFETAGKDRNIELFEPPPRSPERNGHVERNNGAWCYEFHAACDLPENIHDLNQWIDAFADEFNTFTPHQAPGGQTPIEYLDCITANETPTAHMS